MITIKETTQRGASFQPDNKGSARRMFEAVCTAGEKESDIKAALAASDYSVKLGSVHDSDAAKKCRSIDPQAQGGGVWQIAASYDYPPPGASWESETPATSTGIRWEKFKIVEKMDRDAAGNLLMNAARIPFEGGQDVELIAHRLSVTKYFETYQLSAFAGCDNSVNLAAVKIPAASFRLDADVTVAADNMKFVGCSVAAYTLTAPELLAHEFTFEWFELMVGGASLVAPWDYRFRNTSRVGWADTDGLGLVKVKGVFTNKDGAVLQEPELLSNSGVPLDSTVRVLTHGSKSLFSPISPPGGAPTGAVFEGDGSWVRYQRLPRLNFVAKFPWFQSVS